MPIVVAIDAVSPAAVNVAVPVIGPVSDTVTAELSAVAVSALPINAPVTSPVNVASAPFVPALSTTLLFAANTSPFKSPINSLVAVISVPVIAAAPPIAPPIMTPFIVPPTIVAVLIFALVATSNVSMLTSAKSDVPIVDVTLPVNIALVAVVPDSTIFVPKLL